MRQWQPIRHGSPQQIRQATLSSPRRVFISENRKWDPAPAASCRAIRAATIATSSDPNGVVQVTENAPLHWTFEMHISLLLIAVTNIAVGNGALSWIQVEEMWFDAGRESLDTVSWNSFQQVERDCVNKVW